MEFYVLQFENPAAYSLYRIVRDLYGVPVTAPADLPITVQMMEEAIFTILKRKYQ